MSLIRLLIFHLLPLWLLLPFMITHGIGDKSVVKYIETIVSTLTVFVWVLLIWLVQHYSQLLSRVMETFYFLFVLVIIKLIVVDNSTIASFLMSLEMP